jgi:hypothetical protein
VVPVTDFSIADPDTVHDLGWFEEHRERRYYVRSFVLPFMIRTLSSSSRARAARRHGSSALSDARFFPT